MFAEARGLELKEMQGAHTRQSVNELQRREVMKPHFIHIHACQMKQHFCFPSALGPGTRARSAPETLESTRAGVAAA